MATKQFSDFIQVSASTIDSNDFIVGYYYNNSDEIRITLNELSNYFNKGTAFLPLSGGTLTGNISVGSNLITASTSNTYPTAPGVLTNKAYVDDQISTAIAAAGSGVTPTYVQTRFLPLSGGTVTGTVDFGSNNITTSHLPVGDYDVTNKAYVTTYVANQIRANSSGSSVSYLPLSGGTMTGSVNFGSNNITTSHTAASNTDVTNKAYVDQTVLNATNNGATQSWVETYFLPLSGGTMSGLINSPSIPTAVDHLTNKQYVDTHFLPLSGGTMSGLINSPSIPTAVDHLTNKQYVDQAVLNATGGGANQSWVETRFLPLSGGTVTGTVDFGSNNITTSHTAASNTDVVNFAALQAAIQSLVPSGTVVSFAGRSVPSGWVLCDGSSYITTGIYANLYAAINTTYGSGTGTFKVPDLRGYFIRGYGTNRDGTQSGSFGINQADVFRSHTHTTTENNHSHNISHSQINTPTQENAAIGQGSFISGWAGTSSNDHTTDGAKTGLTINSSGGSETRPVNIAMNYIIKL
jgi:microcystin-dependent protein